MNTPHTNGIPKSVFRLALSLLVLLPFTVATFAQSDPVDASYTPSFINVGNVTQTMVQPDGKILVVGGFTTANGINTKGGLVRLNADGTIDPAFQIPQTARISSIALLPDGKILFVDGGTFSPTPVVGKLNADGTLDATFNADVTRIGIPASVLVQPDGKILVTGIPRIPDPTGLQRSLNRLNADGSLDTNFNPAGFGAGTFVTSMKLSGPRILVTRQSFAQSLLSVIIGLNNDGSPDTGFSPANLGSGNSSITVLSSGKVFLSGFFSTVNGVTQNGVARLNADGTLDQTFNSGTGLSPMSGTGSVELPDGKVLLTGEFTSYNGVSRQNIARINADGTLDPTFNPTGGANAETFAISRLSDGRLLIGGLFSNYGGIQRTGLVRTMENGAIDSGFSVDLRRQGSVSRLAVQSDNKALVAGFFNLANGLTQVNITRLNTNGAADTGFLNTAGISIFGSVQAMIVQENGKILIGGSFQMVNGTTRLNLARLNADGTLDTTFLPSNPDGSITGLASQPDGKIIISGQFRTVGGSARAGIARLNADGTNDQSFIPANLGNLPGSLQFKVLADGKILVGGLGVVVRLNSDGSLDPTFTSDLGLPSLVCFQNDGQILFVEIGPDSSSIFRLNPNGSLDPTFTELTIPETANISLRVAPDNKIVIRAVFFTPAGTPNALAQRERILRLNPDGTPDPTFSTTLGVTGQVDDFGIQSDGRILLAGSFASVGGTTFSPPATLLRLNATTTNNCSFGVAPTSFHFSQAGGTGTLTVTTGTDCVWTSSDIPSWIGNLPRVSADERTVQFHVRPNTGAARTATFTVAGQTVTVNQAATGTGSAGAFRPSTGFVYIRNANTTGFADREFFYGQAGDVPIAGDWNGDGADTIGIYRNGTFFLRNSNNSGFADLQFPFGAPGDIPIVGDWDGDGIDTIGVVRGNTVFLRNSNTAGDADIQFNYGNATDRFLAGDWDGDGIDTVGAYRPSNGFVYLRNSNSSGFADTEFFYGLAGDRPVAGDWNHDGVDTIGVVRGNRWLLRNSNTSGFADIDFNYGLETDIPIAGDWDGQP